MRVAGPVRGGRDGAGHGDVGQRGEVVQRHAGAGERARQLAVADGAAARDGARDRVDRDVRRQPLERDQLAGVGDRRERVPRAEHADARRARDDLPQLLERLRAMHGGRAVGVVAGPVAHRLGHHDLGMTTDAFPSAGARHPVAELLRERRDAGSRPGARTDPHRVALVLEGGGMRGVVSAGMTAALERLGLTPCFDLVVGASAGAINGAALVAGVAQHGAATYHGPLASRSFVNPARILRGRPVIDVNRILDFASGGLDEGRHERVLASPIALHCVAVAVDTAQPVVLTGMRTKRELWDAILASSRMPLAGGPAGGDRRAALHRRRHGRADPGRRGDRGRRDARAGAADAALRRAAQERVTARRPADRAPPARAQPGARDALPGARRRVRARGRRHRAALARPGCRAAARARAAAARGHALRRAARAALADPGARGRRRRAARRARAAGGAGVPGPFKTVAMDDVRATMESKFWGAWRVARCGRHPPRRIADAGFRLSQHPAAAELRHRRRRQRRDRVAGAQPRARTGAGAGQRRVAGDHRHPDPRRDAGSRRAATCWPRRRPACRSAASAAARILRARSSPS